MNFNFKNLFIKLAFIMLVFNFKNSQAQVINCSLLNGTYGGTIAATGGTNFVTYANYGPGYYMQWPVLNGGSYAISTCGAPIDDQITVWGGFNTNMLLYNDDNGPYCTGSAASGDFVPNLTNYVYMMVSEYPCLQGGSASINVYYRQNNNLTFTSSSAALCSGQSRSLTATPASVGSVPDANYGDPGTFSGTGVVGNVFTAPVVSAPTNYTLTYTFGYVSQTQVITVMPNPTVTANTSANPVCNGQMVTLSGGGASTYTWSGGVTNGVAFSPSGTNSYTVSGTSSFGCVSTNSAVITVTANPAIITSSASTNVLCFGNSTGSATITASGGTSPYSYLWSSAQTTSVVSGQTAGVRTVTVTDANACNATNTVAIVQPASALATATAVINVACFGNATGAATVTTTGGTSSYSYLWSTGATTSVIASQTPGTKSYTVTDANGCTTSGNAIISQPASALATATAVSNVLCFGNSTGSATVTATGGTSSYSYLWSTGATTSVITSQTSGVKTVTVTDANGCTSIKSVSVSQPATALATSTAVSNVACFGNSTGAATVTTTGGTSSYSYLWSTGATTSVITSQTIGTKSYTVTDANGCTTSGNAIISQPASALATATAVTNVLCFGNSTGSATVTTTGGTSSYSYLWSTGATTSVIASQTPGTKSYTVTDANGCNTSGNAIISQPASALATATAVTNVLCFGNSTGSATVTTTGGTSSYTYLWSTGATTSVITSQTSGVKTVTVTDVNGCTSIKSVSISQPASALATSTNVTNVLCNGGSTGSATITAVGGTSGYTYLWSTGATTSVITSQNPGTKSYTVTDANGCNTISSINITEPTALNVSSSSSSILCNGGVSTITVSAVNGTSPYTGTGTYTMNAGTNTYTVTDNNGCSATTSITVAEPAALNVSSLSSSILCNGGVSTITVSATDGTSPYTGVGTFTANAGTQTYTVSDANGCSTTTSVSVTEPLTLNVSSVVSSSAICTGAIATVTVTATDGTSPYTGTGTYTVNSANTYTVTDANGCMATTNVSLTVNPLPTLVAISSSTLLCTGETATLSVTGATTYTWSTTENTPDIAITPTVQTTYTVDGIDANGCSNSTTVTQDVSLCTGIATLSGVETPLISVYPNPNNGLFVIDLTAASQVIVTNAFGQIVLTETMETGKTSIDIHNEATGIYFVKVIHDEKQYTIKLIKQ